jgi:hypothetical protein
MVRGGPIAIPLRYIFFSWRLTFLSDGETDEAERHGAG